MPRFFFDTDDGNAVVRDAYGIELPDQKAARDIAVTTLPHLAEGAPLGSDQTKMAVHVKDTADHAVLDATMKLEVEWKESATSELPNPQQPRSVQSR